MTHVVRRLIGALLVAFGLLTAPLVAPTGATAAPASCEYPASVCACPTLAVSTSAPLAGEAITVAGTHFVSRARVGIFLKPAASGDLERLTTLQTSTTGDFTTSVTVPEQSSGRFTVMAVKGTPTAATTAAGIRCPANPTAPLEVTVLAERNDPASTEDGTAFTGVNLLWLLLVAAALVGVGVHVHRRGRTTGTVRSIHG